MAIHTGFRELGHPSPEAKERKAGRFASHTVASVLACTMPAAVFVVPRATVAQLVADSLKPTTRITEVANAARLANTPFDVVAALHGDLNIGKTKIAYQPTRGVPKSPEDVERTNAGDCSDLDYYMQAAFTEAGLEKMDGVKTGAIFFHGKGDAENIWSHVPIVLIKGEVPKDARYAPFENDATLRDQVKSVFGLENLVGWHMVIVDPQVPILGRIFIGVEKPRILNSSGVRAQYFAEQGMFELKANKPKRAKPLLEQAVALDPQDAVSLFNLGFIYYKLGDIDKGIEYLKRAEKVDVYRLTTAKQAAADLLVEKGVGLVSSNPEAAVAALEEAYSLNPEHPKFPRSLGIAYFNLGATKANAGDLEAAKAALLKAKSLGINEADSILKQIQ